MVAKILQKGKLEEVEISLIFVQQNLEIREAENPDSQGKVVGHSCLL